MNRSDFAFGKAAAMNVVMQIIHLNQTKFRGRSLTGAIPENVDDNHGGFRTDLIA